MSRHRAEAPPVIALADGVRVRWQPAREYDQPGTFTGPDSMIERIRAAITSRQQVPLRGVLVTAEDVTAVGVMAAIEVASHKHLRFVEVPSEVDTWFAENRKVVVPVTADDMAAVPERSFKDKVGSALRRRVI